MTATVIRLAEIESGPRCGEAGGLASVYWSVINLDRSPDRLDTMAQSLAALSIGFTRTPAVDGRRLTLPLPGIDPALYRSTWGRALQLDEVGCFLSHLRAMRDFLGSRCRFAMILEDDALVTPDAVRLVGLLTAEGAPDDWDLVKFEAHGEVTGLPIRRVSGPHRLCALPIRTRGAAAYLLNRAAAEAMLARLLPMQAPLDHVLDRGWALGTRVRGLLPMPVTTTKAVSTIARTDRTPRRTSSAVWRATTKSMLMISALQAWADPARRSPGRPVDLPEGERLYDRIEALIGEPAAMPGPVVGSAWPPPQLDRRRSVP